MVNVVLEVISQASTTGREPVGSPPAIDGIRVMREMARRVLIVLVYE